MEKFHWDDTYSVGVSQMDDEHRIILSTINQMLDAPDVSAGSEAISNILTQLAKYASKHFEHEERLLKEHGYPDLSAHRGEHQLFRREVAAFCLSLMDEQTPTQGAYDDLLRFLRRWWNEHILIEDMQYRSFLNQLGIT